MLEENIRTEVSRLLHSMGFEAYHPPDIKQTASARPDIFSLNPQGRSFVIEVKRIEQKVNVEEYFEYAKISKRQRQWLDRWFRRGGYGFLALGTVGPGRQLFIIPWSDWASFEKKSHKIDATKVSMKSIQEAFGTTCEAKWLGNTNAPFPIASWELPEAHSLRSIKSAFVPVPMTNKDWNDTNPFSMRF